LTDKMFADTKTWNPFTGCIHECPYCWFKLRVLPRVSKTDKYRNGMVPTVHNDLVRKGPPNCKQSKIFVVDCGDAFCKGFYTDDIIRLLDSCHNSKLVKNFMLLTKNPGRYLEVLAKRPDIAKDRRFIWGATIETTNGRHGHFHTQLAPYAPEPWYRADAMMALRQTYPDLRIFLSLEPVMEMDVGSMLTWIQKIKPEFIYAGYDGYNYVSKQVELSLQKFDTLVLNARMLTTVHIKKVRQP